MDELIIGDKKYLSSKQAAKVTGYAKDYIGQLCREGRVPARLVGRSWYVLESALKDHRFGEKTVQETKAEKRLTGEWESPRYEPVPVEALPNRHEEREAALAEENELTSDEDMTERLQESWKAWFEHVAQAAPAIPDVVPEEPKEEPVEEQKEEEVPIRTVRHLPPEELLPNRRAAVLMGEDFERAVEERHGAGTTQKLLNVVRVSSAVIALIMVSIAVLGSGYFDDYVFSSKPASAVAGVILYNK